MASYKPKKLDELNEIYDKTIIAQRAIQKGVSKLNAVDSSDNSKENATGMESAQAFSEETKIGRAHV